MKKRSGLAHLKKTVKCPNLATVNSHLEGALKKKELLASNLP